MIAWLRALDLWMPIALRRRGVCLLQLAGTRLVRIREPGRALQEGHPLPLTQTGEFVVKNLVLMAAGLVVGATADAPHEAIEPADAPFAPVR